jgi:hypothetical protein
MIRISSRPEIAFVLLLVQVSFWLLAAVSALIFVIPMPATGLYVALTMLATAAGLLLSAGLLERRRWARRWTVRLEAVCLAGSLLLLVVPLGTSRAPVALLCNVGLPLALLWLLAGRRARMAFFAP